VVAFDLDDTLLDHRHAERAALADVQQAFPDHLGAFDIEAVCSTYHAVNVPLWREFGAGRIDADTLKHRRATGLLDGLGVLSLAPETFTTVYLACYAERWTWVEGAREAYARVAAAYPVGLLTNGFSAQQRGKLARFPELEAQADWVVVSEEVGAMKPSPAIFAHATAQAAHALGTPLDADEVLYVGDSLHSDIEGGTGFGWQVAWFRGDAAHADHGTAAFTHWPDLLARLGLG
jgi:HAD superfamily hydrolase (TIGR01549 family)